MEVFADVACPFAHVALRRLRLARAARGSDAELVVRAWPLELVNGRPLDPQHVAREIADLRAQIVPDLFLAFDAGAFPETSIPAFGLARAAYDRDVGLGEQVSIAVRDALFEDGRPIGDHQVLAQLAARYGLDVPDPDRAREVVAADWDEGRRRGVEGSPHFFVGDESEFCPALRIEKRDGDHLHIERDDARLHAFLDRALG